MERKTILILLTTILVLLPLVGLGAPLGPDGSADNDPGALERAGGAVPVETCGQLTDFKSLVNCAIIMVVKPLVALLIGLALLYFLWGIITYIKGGDNEKKHSEGRQMMIWGIIALFVMVSVWGLVSILTGTFQFDNSEPPIPTFKVK